MTIISILEQLANTAHYHANPHHLMQDQDQNVQQAFLTNNSNLLQSQFKDTATIVAHRSHVVQISHV